jgi:hypothetical protein
MGKLQAIVMISIAGFRVHDQRRSWHELRNLLVPAGLIGPEGANGQQAITIYLHHSPKITSKFH